MVSSAPGSHQAHFFVRFSGFNEEIIIIIKSLVKPHKVNSFVKTNACDQMSLWP